MPTYGYRCNACGYEFEVFQSITADPLDTCPECSGQIRRIIFPVGIVFKGPGFYVTDNSAKAKNPASAADSEASTDKPKTDASSSETKQTATSASTDGAAAAKSDTKTPVTV